MIATSDVMIHNSRGSYLLLLCGGLLFAVFGGLVLYDEKTWNNGTHLIGALIFVVMGSSAIVHAVISLFDRSVKLSLTADGLKDHRTGDLIRWADFRDAQLKVAIGRYRRIASLWVKVADGQGEREVSVDVLDLDRKPQEIEQLVQEWRKTAQSRSS